MAEKKNLKVIPWERVGVRLNTPARTIKMLRPVCPETSMDPDGNYTPGCESKHIGAWWLKCEEKGHQPYLQEKEVTKRKRKTEVTPDGRTVVKATEEEIEIEQTPRVAQVPLGLRTNSHTFVEDKRFWGGFVMPQDKEYAPMCQFRNCFAPNPKFKTEFGDYCSENEARMMIAEGRHLVLEVFNQEKRKDQLRGINVA